MIKAIAFDLFGVVYQDLWKKWKNDNQVRLEDYAESNDPLPLVELGLRRSYPGYFEDLLRLNTDERSDISPPLISDEQLYKILSEASGMPAKEIRAIIHDTSVVNLEVVELIKSLRSQNLKIALIANADKSITDEFLDQHDLRRLFDVSFISSEIGIRKPGGFFFDILMERLELKNHKEVIIIDDSNRVVKQANQMGFRAIRYNDLVEETKAQIEALLQLDSARACSS